MRRLSGFSLGAPALLVALSLGVSGCGDAPSTGLVAAPSPSAAAASSAALGTLIEAEDAAIYAYGVIGAHLTGSSQARAVASLAAHQRLRDAWIALALADGQEIPAAAIAYDLPIDVRDKASAQALSTEIETRLIAVYESAGEIAGEALAKARARLARSTTAG